MIHNNVYICTIVKLSIIAIQERQRNHNNQGLVTAPTVVKHCQKPTSKYSK